MNHSMLPFASNPGTILGKAFEEKTARNPMYSLRAFARDLGVSHTLLSLAIRGKKLPSAKMCVRLARRIAPSFATPLMEAAKAASDLEALAQPPLRRIRKKEFKSLQSKAVSRLLKRWHYLAILDLTALRDFRAEPEWIAEAIGISVGRAARALELLVHHGLLKKEGERWVKDPGMAAVVPRGRSEKSIRQFHRQMLKKALIALSSTEQDDYEARDISGAIIPIDPRLLPEAKRRIRRFRRGLIGFLSSGESTELYQLNVQLFRLTKKRNEGVRPS